MRRLVLFFVLLQAAAWAQQISVKGNARQGSPLFIAVEGAGADATASWGGKDYALANGRAVLPVPVDMPAGEQVLKIEQDGTTVAERAIKVAPRHFSTQYLSINPSTLASYDNPRNKADDKAILDSMKPLDEEQRWTGNFAYPVTAPETTGFGLKRLYNGWKKGWHKGIDLAAPEGEPVGAPAAGRVVHTATGIVNGNTVVLSHGLGLFTSYFHLQGINVKKGQTVDAGQTIGWVGGTGGFAPHLHWEARCFGVPIDPKSLFQLPAGWR